MSDLVTLPQFPPVADDPEMGPAMAKLRPQQRAWVNAFLETGGKDQTRAAVMSGYGTGGNTSRVAGWRLAHDPLVLAAIKETAERRIRSSALMAIEVMIEVASDPTHKDRFKAAVEVANRSGMLVTQQIEVQHNHSYNDEAAVQRVKVLAQQLGLDPRKLLGSAGVVVDAEFEVVEDRAPAMSAAGLEDLL